jgi:cold shock CspA family protein
MSIPGKMLVAVLSALAVSALTPLLVAQLQFKLLLAPTVIAALLAVILSHKAIPMPSGLAGSSQEAKAASKPSPASASRSAAKPKAKSSPKSKSRAPAKARTPSAAQPQQTERPAARSAGAETGTVKWFNSSKGFGFIVRDNGEEIFVHHRSVKGDGRSSLRDGAEVRFTVVTTDKGPQAEDVEQVD